jgi:hypothetical protein
MLMREKAFSDKLKLFFPNNGNEGGLIFGTSQPLDLEKGELFKITVLINGKTIEFFSDYMISNIDFPGDDQFNIWYLISLKHNNHQLLRDFDLNIDQIFQGKIEIITPLEIPNPS